MNNFGVILASHGKFATESLNVAKMIAGNFDNFIALELKENDSKQEFKKEFIEKFDSLQEKYDFVICLCDIYGGTPFNIVIESVIEGKDFIAYAGFNMPMILELCMLDQINKDDAEKIIEEVYKRSLVNMKDLVYEKEKEIDL
ncbi:MAG: hypothetical protein Q4B36_07605 [Tissierellia bacterium]|nr:hypothetical protein [Tissierellia bacterium]